MSKLIKLSHKKSGKPFLISSNHIVKAIHREENGIPFSFVILDAMEKDDRTGEDRIVQFNVQETIEQIWKQAREEDLYELAHK